MKLSPKFEDLFNYIVNNNIKFECIIISGANFYGHFIYYLNSIYNIPFYSSNNFKIFKFISNLPIFGTE